MSEQRGEARRAGRVVGRWWLARRSWGWLAAAWSRSRGWLRVGLIVLLVVAVVLGGFVGVAVSLLLVVSWLSLRIGQGVSRWRLRAPARYCDEVDRTAAATTDQLVLFERELVWRDREIARLREQQQGRADRG